MLHQSIELRKSVFSIHESLRTLATAGYKLKYQRKKHVLQLSSISKICDIRYYRVDHIIMGREDYFLHKVSDSDIKLGIENIDANLYKIALTLAKSAPSLRFMHEDDPEFKKIR